MRRLREWIANRVWFARWHLRRLRINWAVFRIDCECRLADFRDALNRRLGRTAPSPTNDKEVENV